MRGSIISSVRLGDRVRLETCQDFCTNGFPLIQDASANRTTYTIFCPQQTPQACNLALEFPFIFVEGPETVEFHGTYTSTLYVLPILGTFVKQSS